MNQPVPRIAPLARDEWTEAARDVFSFFEGPAAREAGSWSNTMMTLANHPPLAMSQLGLAGHVLGKGSTLSHREKELIVLRVAWRYGSAYQWAQHLRIAGGIGFTEEEFAALGAQDPGDRWSEADRAVISAVDDLCDRGRVEDGTWAVLAGFMDRHRLMDLLYAAGFFAMNAWALNSMGVQIEAPRG